MKPMQNQRELSQNYNSHTSIYSFNDRYYQILKLIQVSEWKLWIKFSWFILHFIF